MQVPNSLVHSLRNLDRVAAEQAGKLRLAFSNNFPSVG